MKKRKKMKTTTKKTQISYIRLQLFKSILSESHAQMYEQIEKFLTNLSSPFSKSIFLFYLSFYLDRMKKFSLQIKQNWRRKRNTNSQQTDKLHFHSFFRFFISYCGRYHKSNTFVVDVNLCFSQRKTFE